ncbi:MAG: DUF2911 domain-containing protein [Bacteroidota bacterium]
MKSSIFVLLVLCTASVFAQDVGGKTLVSQSRSTQANIGKCDITIDYHSPSVDGRKIFGGIVPFDFVVDGVEYPWRAGSNQRTTIEFSHPVEIEGQKLDSGSYGFVVLISEEEWTLIFSSGKSWGAFNYDKANDVLRVPVKTQQMPFQEWLSYDFINPKAESVDIQLRWENTAVTFNVRTNALDNIIGDLQAKEEKTISDLQNLALRTLERDPSKLDEALTYLEESFSKIEELEQGAYRKAYTYNYKVVKGEILLEKGKKKEANELIDEAMASASGFNVYYYSLNKLTVRGERDVAFDVLKESIKRDPKNFQNHFAFGEFYLKEGNQKKATEHFKKAYEMTVDQKSRWENYARYLYLQNKLVLENN